MNVCSFNGMVQPILFMEEILHQLIMVHIPLFTGFHTCWVVSRISSINSWDPYNLLIISVWLGSPFFIAHLEKKWLKLVAKGMAVEFLTSCHFVKPPGLGRMCDLWQVLPAQSGCVEGASKPEKQGANLAPGFLAPKGAKYQPKSL